MSETKHCGNCGWCAVNHDFCRHPSDDVNGDSIPIAKHIKRRSKPAQCPGWTVDDTEYATPEPDPIHEPAHYQSGDGSDIECIDTVRAMLSDDEYRGYLRGTLHTYLWRYKRKNGVEDLRKAQRYLDWLKEHEERNR